MARFEIPIQQSTGREFSFRTSLFGVQYRFRFYFNDRAQTWNFDLADGAGVDVANGMLCGVNYSLLSRVSDDRRPRGFLYAIDTSGQNIDPGINDLGGRVRLVYDDGIS